MIVQAYEFEAILLPDYDDVFDPLQVWFTFEFEWTILGFKFDSGLVGGGSKNVFWSYGVGSWCETYAKWSWIWFEWWLHELKGIMVIYDITAANMKLQGPTDFQSAATTSQWCFSTDYDITMFVLKVKVNQNARICNFSAMDMALGLVDGENALYWCYFDSGNENDYYDPFLHYHPLDALVTSLGISTWYGSHDYYSYCM